MGYDVTLSERGWNASGRECGGLMVAALYCIVAFGLICVSVGLVGEMVKALTVSRER
jgi:hypothetical protein